MERVGVLIEKLQEQLVKQADIQNMLITTQLLQSELLLLLSTSGVQENKKVAVVVPNNFGVINPAEITVLEKQAIPEIEKTEVEKDIAAQKIKTIEPEIIQAIPVVEQLPEEVVEIEETTIAQPAIEVKEPEPIAHFIEQDVWKNILVKKEEDNHWGLDPMLDFPTLAHQEKVVYELNDIIAEENTNASLNEKLKENKPEMVSLLQETPVKDLKKAISINDRHRFIHELFRGDETMYERSIKTINGFHIFAEAEYWIQRELKIKLGWDVSLELVKTFDQLVKRRFA